MFEGVSGGKLRTFVVWIPILGSDGRPAADEASEMFHDVDAPQYWDGAQLLGHAIARGLRVDGWVAWDIYLFYPPEAVWTDAGPPEPQTVLAQAAGAVVAAKGTLPPRGDAAGLPAALRERVDVVGTPDDLAELLSRVAGRFAR